MQDSFEGMSRQGIKNFLGKLCVAGSRHAEMHRNIRELDSHLEKLKKDAEFGKEPHQKSIERIVGNERKLISYREHDARQNELLQRISQLERELEKTRKERDEAVEKNGKQLQELSLALSSAKSKISSFIHEKQDREKRFRELEAKIKKRVP